MPQVEQRRKMGCIAIMFHATMMLFTLGLWTPILLAARRRRVTVMYLPDAPQQPPAGYQPPQWPQR